MLVVQYPYYQYHLYKSVYRYHIFWFDSKGKFL
jgi:hypothetical protein